MNFKKVSTYSLLIVTTIIWGTIAYKFLFKNSRRTKENTRIKSDTANEKLKNNLEFFLLLNYRNPFVGKMDIPDSSLRVKPISVKNPTSPIAHNITESIGENTSYINYKGYIRSRDQITALLNFHGKLILLNEKEIIGNFRVYKIFPDSLILTSKNRKYKLLKL